MPQKQKTTEKTKLVERPPVVVVMGHVDHGKSTLLDYIRSANVTATEAGGITQHTSAYEVVHKNENGVQKKITFLDTPGHEAFTLMRKRGAELADIAVLVVAADDGVKPQTLEALSAIKEKKIPYIVALNKIDKPQANVERAKQTLAEHEVFLEGYGGDVPVIEVSAKTGKGVPELLSLILLIAELGEFKADTEGSAQGTIVESHRDSKRGNSATVVIKNGVLKKGMYGISGDTTITIKRIEDFLGKSVEEATFSSPVELMGFSSIPAAGSAFTSFATKKEFDAYIKQHPSEKFQKKSPAREAGGGTRQIPENPEEIRAEIPLVIKTDTLGTLEAIVAEIEKIKSERVDIQIIHKGIGNISEFDIRRASGEGRALVIGFQVSVEDTARRLSEQLEIPIQLFDIIYKLSEWLAEECAKRRPRQKVEETIGKAKIIRLFNVSKHKQVIGGKVVEGRFLEGRAIKILRREHEIGRGKIVELQQKKVRTKEVAEGLEFGAMVEAKLEIAPGDILEVFDVVEK